MAPIPPKAPRPPKPPNVHEHSKAQSGDRNYDRGTRALDEGRWVD